MLPRRSRISISLLQLLPGLATPLQTLGAAHAASRQQHAPPTAAGCHQRCIAGSRNDHACSLSWRAGHIAGSSVGKSARSFSDFKWNAGHEQPFATDTVHVKCAGDATVRTVVVRKYRIPGLLPDNGASATTAMPSADLHPVQAHPCYTWASQVVRE
jgi:hypothetical protein